MRITIIPEDNKVIVDGVALTVAPVTAPGIHAIQWYGNHGTVERKAGGAEGFADIAEIQPWLDAWQTAQAIATAPPSAPTQEQVAANARAAAKAARAAAVAAITVTVGGKVFDGDEQSQTRMARAILGLRAAGLPTIVWTLADNTVTPVTEAELTQALILAGQQQAALWPLNV